MIRPPASPLTVWTVRTYYSTKQSCYVQEIRHEDGAVEIKYGAHSDGPFTAPIPTRGRP